MALKSAYTEVETKKLLSLYEQYGTENLEKVAEELNKPLKSVRSKLVKEKVYVADRLVYIKKTGKSKKELLRELETVVGIDASGFIGATKESISQLLEFLEKDDTKWLLKK